MSELFDIYRTFHEQGFVPIFVKDHFDTKLLVEACVRAGLKGIEITLRRDDADTMIPWVRENYPDLRILVGSTIDDERIVEFTRRKFPQVRTLAELDAMGVGGFVSIMGMREETIARYSPTRLVIPCAERVTQALEYVRAGAQMIKVLGPDVDHVRAFRSTPTFGFCPVIVTGGMAIDRLPMYIEAGAVMVGAGFDGMLRGRPADITVDEVTEVLKTFIQATREARERFWPEMSAAIGADRQTWLDSLPHYHPF